MQSHRRGGCCDALPQRVPVWQRLVVQCVRQRGHCRPRTVRSSGPARRPKKQLQKRSESWVQRGVPLRHARSRALLSIGDVHWTQCHRGTARGWAGSRAVLVFVRTSCARSHWASLCACGKWLRSCPFFFRCSDVPLWGLSSERGLVLAVPGTYGGRNFFGQETVCC